MADDKEIEKIVQRAIPLSSCPTTKANEITRRVWLKREILKLLANVPVKTHGPTEFK